MIINNSYELYENNEIGKGAHSTVYLGKNFYDNKY